MQAHDDEHSITWKNY